MRAAAPWLLLVAAGARACNLTAPADLRLAEALTDATRPAPLRRGPASARSAERPAQVEYIDGALLVWDAARPAAAALACAWWAEYDRPDSSDRDQLAFARAVTTLLPPDADEDPARLFEASTRRGGVALISEGGGRPGACGGLCHQYDATSTAVGSAGAKVLAPSAPSAPCSRVVNKAGQLRRSRNK